MVMVYTVEHMLQFTALWKKAQMNREWTKQASLLIQGKITYFV